MTALTDRKVFYQMLWAWSVEDKIRYGNKLPLPLIFVTFWWGESAIQAWLKYRVGAWICKRFGHSNLIHDDWANPERGGEYFECPRCGWSQTIHYY